MEPRTAGMTSALNQPKIGNLICAWASQRPAALKPALSVKAAVPTSAAVPSSACLL